MIGGFLIVIISHGLEVINNYVSAKLEQNMMLDLRSDLFDHAASYRSPSTTSASPDS